MRSVILSLLAALSIRGLAIPNGVEVKPGAKNLPPVMTAVVKLDMESTDPKTGEVRRWICTGTVISKSPPLILTARHCTDDPNGVTASAITFLAPDFSPIKKVKPAELKFHHDPTSPTPRRMKDDYAVIQMAQADEIPATVTPAEFPRPADCPLLEKPPGGMDPRAFFAGYGANRVDWVKRKGPNGLQEAVLVGASGAGTLRYGFNHVQRANGTAMNGMFSFPGLRHDLNSVKPGESVSVGPGDSGGPVLTGKKGRTLVAGIHKRIDRSIFHNNDGQFNFAVDTCGDDVNRFVNRLLNPLWMTPRGLASAEPAESPAARWSRRGERGARGMRSRKNTGRGAH